MLEHPELVSDDAAAAVDHRADVTAGGEIGRDARAVDEIEVRRSRDLFETEWHLELAALDLALAEITEVDEDVAPRAVVHLIEAARERRLLRVEVHLAFDLVLEVLQEEAFGADASALELEQAAAQLDLVGRPAPVELELDPEIDTSIPRRSSDGLGFHRISKPSGSACSRSAAAGGGVGAGSCARAAAADVMSNRTGQRCGRSVHSRSFTGSQATDFTPHVPSPMSCAPRFLERGGGGDRHVIPDSHFLAERDFLGLEGHPVADEHVLHVGRRELLPLAEDVEAHHAGLLVAEAVEDEQEETQERRAHAGDGVEPEPGGHAERHQEEEDHHVLRIFDRGPKADDACGSGDAERTGDVVADDDRGRRAGDREQDLRLLHRAPRVGDVRPVDRRDEQPNRRRDDESKQRIERVLMSDLRRAAEQRRILARLTAPVCQSCERTNVVPSVTTARMTAICFHGQTRRRASATVS